MSVNSCLDKSPAKEKNSFAFYFDVYRTGYFDFALKQLFSVLRSCVLLYSKS